MNPETEKCMKECLRISKRINCYQFNTMQQLMRLVEVEEKLLNNLEQMIMADLEHYHPRFNPNQDYLDDSDDDLSFA